MERFSSLLALASDPERLSAAVARELLCADRVMPPAPQPHQREAAKRKYISAQNQAGRMLPQQRRTLAYLMQRNPAWPLLLLEDPTLQVVIERVLL